MGFQSICTIQTGFFASLQLKKNVAESVLMEKAVRNQAKGKECYEQKVEKKYRQGV
jgi:hypothetical protein